MSTQHVNLPDFLDITKSLYQVLGVSEDAMEADIKQKYLQLSRIYHPDRHAGSEENQQFAHDKFPEIDFAKQILLNPKLRSVYDKFDYDGLNAILPLVTSNAPPRSLMKEINKLEAFKQRTVFGTINCPVDLRKETITDSFSKLFYSHGVKKFLNDSLLGEISGGLLFTKRSTEHAYIEGALHWFGTSYNIRTGATLSSDPTVNFAFEKILGDGSSAGVSTEYSYLQGPDITFTYSSDRSRQWQNSFRVNLDGTFVPTIQYHQVKNPHPDIPWYKNINFSVSPNLVTVGRKLTSEGFLKHINAHFYMSTSSFGIIVHRKAEKQSKIGFSSGWNYVHSLFDNKFLVTVGGYDITFPLVIPAAGSLPFNALGLIGPPLLFIAGSVFWDGFVQEIWDKRTFLRVIDAEEILLAEEAAKKDISMMKESVSQIVEKERQNGGIVIIEAWYGNFDSSAPLVADVTIPVQNLVSDYRLRHKSKQPKHEIEGFYDPCPHKRKQLWIHYQFRGNSNHSVLIDDRQPFSLPKSDHTKGPKKPF